MRINRTVELLAADQPVYYTGEHAGPVPVSYTPLTLPTNREV